MATRSIASLTGTTSPKAIHADLEHISFDPALTGKIMKKRQEEMHRRSKLLDPRKRQYGVDHHILDAQIQEKRAAQEAEADEEEYYAKTVLLQEEVAQACEKMKDAATRDRKKASVAYSLEHLRKEQRREYALSDPSELKKDRILTEEEMLQFGPSSMMSLGERPEDALARKKDKQAQMRAWLHEQMKEKQARYAEEREVERMHDQEAAFANQVRTVCEKAAKEEAREDKIAEAAENLEIAEHHMQRRQAKLNKNIMMNDQHVNTVMRDPRMVEKYDYLIGSNGKLMKGEYRRLSQAEQQDVFNTNAVQIINKKALKRAEKMEDMEQAEGIGRSCEVLQAIEQEKKRMVLDRRLQAEDHNKKLAAIKAEMDLLERRNYMSYDPNL